MPGAILYVKHPTSGQLIPVKADADGKLVISDADPFTIVQDTPENLKHVPHGYYSGGPSYLPFKVDADGVVQISAAVTGNLNDLADVSVPSPADQDLFYYDTATGLWKSRALVDADIPAAIARDAEVTAAIAAQKLDDHAAPDDNTDNDASTSKHGLLPKLSGAATDFLNGLGAWAVPAGGGGGVTPVLKTADQTVNNSTTVVDDNELKLTVGASEVWAFLMLLKIATTAVADFKFTFSVPTAGVVNFFDKDGVVLSNWNEAATTRTLSTGSDRTNGWAVVFGIYIGGANAGTLQFRWAQNAAEATDTKVLTNSCLIAFQMA